jgi:transposase InsO family protein
VVDLLSRRVVGWSMSAAMTARLVTDALVMAIWRRGKPDALVHHARLFCYSAFSDQTPARRRVAKGQELTRPILGTQSCRKTGKEQPFTNLILHGA